MNDQERELIAELAQGVLSPAEADAAFVRVAADTELSLEYEAQVAALAFLHSADTPRLTVTERESLHVNLMQQLGLTPVAAAAAPKKRRSRWLQPALGLVTVAGVFAAVVILPNVLSGSSSDTADFVALSPVTTEAPLSQSSATTTAAASGSPESAVSAEADDGNSLFFFREGTVELDGLLEKVQGARSTDEIVTLLTATSAASRGSLASSPDVPRCIDVLQSQFLDENVDILPIGIEGDAAGDILLFGYDHGDGIQSVVSVDATTCEIVDSK